VAFAAVLSGLWMVMRRRADAMLRFAVLFAGCFTSIPILFYWQRISFLPQPGRYQLEMDQAVCLLAASALYPALRRLPRRAGIVCVALGVVALAWLTVKNCEFARRLIHPANVAQTVAYREARWIGEHLPGERVLVAGEGEYWFNLFANNPQLSAGHDPSAPNWMQRVAVYIIYSGQGAGDQDGPVSVFWLKAFGVGAVTVPGPRSSDHYHPIAHPAKFEGLMPLLWREGDDSIYHVPLRSTSLAHVIPASAIVRRQPLHGVDIDPMRAYVAALDDASLAPATLTWANPERGRISTTLAPGQVVSLQINYDPGWHASVDGRPLPVRRDEIGLTIIEPDRAGKCVIDVEFNGGAERRFCFAVSLTTLILLAGMVFWRQNKETAAFRSSARLRESA
jgi:hypothetical protein